MPYVDIAQGNDFASLWYITNSPTGHVSSFDPDKPTVILLHPFFLDSTWLDSQFCDPRLNEDYNLIAFDQRAAGRTLSRPNGKQDSWSDAADLAFACHVRNVDVMHIPRNPSLLNRHYSRHSGYLQHMFGRVRRQRPIWVSASLHCTQPLVPFKLLFFPTLINLNAFFRFPHRVLSLTMLSVPSPTECVFNVRSPSVVVSDFGINTRLEAYFHTCDELLHMWAHAEDLDTLEFALMQVVTYIAGPVCIATNFTPCSSADTRPRIFQLI